jgi:mannose-6-phosphate isomerase-like protein (cupin superfamily)
MVTGITARREVQIVCRNLGHTGHREARIGEGSYNGRSMDHPTVLRPADHAEWRPDRMGKSTLFESARMLVGINAFEPEQQHTLHSHAGMDKVYYVVEGSGVFLLQNREEPMRAGDLMVAPEGIPHGIRNTGTDRLVVLAILAPGPGAAKG